MINPAINTNGRITWSITESVEKCRILIIKKTTAAVNAVTTHNVISILQIDVKIIKMKERSFFVNVLPHGLD